MKIGIIGPMSSGKTTVFQSVTGLIAEHATGKDATLGVVRVPDGRLEVLTEMYQPKKTTPAEITFADLGSAVLSADKLSALTGALADADALAVIAGGFLGGHPASGLESFLLDLTFADLSVVEARLERIAKEIHRGHKEAQAEQPLMERLQAALGEGQRIAHLELNTEERKTLRGYQFITRKPTLIVANVAEADLGNGVAASVAQVAEAQGLDSLEMCASLELEIAQLPPDDRDVFLADYGMTAAARDRFIRAAYQAADLISFFTVGPDEVRAWSIPRGTLAPSAAGKIHSDIEQGFIRAEIVAYDDLTSAGSLAECRSQGTVRLEGKTYEVQDGDVIDFRFSI